MRFSFTRTLCGLALVFGIGAPSVVRAQSDILLQLRSGSPMGDRGRIDSAGGLVLLSQLGIGIIPASGDGYRLMWHPFKAAFRAGGVDNAGGQWDDANVGFYSWAGGHNTKASAQGTFAFGESVTASVNFGTVFGYNSTVSGTAGFSAGASNTCSDAFCTAIGYTNTASGQGSVALGYRTTADADYAVAIGYRASANGHMGSMMFGDASTTDSIESGVNNEFAVRAAGGFRFRTNATLTTGCSLPAGSGVFSCSSTRSVKHGFLDVNGEDVLGRLSAMPITSWIFNEEPNGVRHLGPVAEDFHSAFGLGADDKTVGLNDLSGVALAAAKALEVRTRELRTTQEALVTRTARLEAVEKELADLKAETKARFERLEAALARSQPAPPK